MVETFIFGRFLTQSRNLSWEQKNRGMGNGLMILLDLEIFS